MHFARIFPLALVMLGACKPDYSACVLVGKWERRTVLPSDWIVPVSGLSAEAEAKCDPANPTDTKRVHAILVATEQFLPTGAWVMWGEQETPPQWGNTKSSLGIRDDGVAFKQFVPIVETSSRWRLFEDRGDRIKIEIREPRVGDRFVGREIAVVDPDHLTYRDGQIEYTMVRVKDAN
jgi:hypothetical protein